MRKSLQLQIRVSPEEKRGIEQLASAAGLDVSRWILRQVIPDARVQFERLVMELNTKRQLAYVLAELNDFLAKLSKNELLQAVATRPEIPKDPFYANYFAAMIELAAQQKQVAAPRWTQDIAPLEKPYFGSSLVNLRLILLRHSPPPFKRRNIFIDSSIGDRI